MDKYVAADGDLEANRVGGLLRPGLFGADPRLGQLIGNPILGLPPRVADLAPTRLAQGGAGAFAGPATGALAKLTGRPDCNEAQRGNDCRRGWRKQPAQTILRTPDTARHRV